MKPVKIRNLILGAGMPKICVPIVGHTLKEIREQSVQAASCHPDIVEWRGDWFQDIRSLDKVTEAFSILHAALGPIPVLYTFRTLHEGGEQDISVHEYGRILTQILEHRYADIVDIEMALGDALVSSWIQRAHSLDTPVILSNHDFEKTPPKQELLYRMQHMESLGCDIAKIAVMPQQASDVICLLDSTLAFAENASCPWITMSMSQLGMISRISGSLTGSCLTFGTAGHSSAPGQLPVEQLREFLTNLRTEF